MAETLGSGSMDEMDIVERQLRLASHGSMMMGESVISDENGEVVSVSPITLDHEMIGTALASDTGFARVEDMLYKDLDPDQQRIYDELVAAGVLPGRTQ